MKEFRKNLEIYFNEVKDLSNRPTHKYNYLIQDEKTGNNLITNSYSFIRLNNNNEKDRKKLEIIKEYGINKSESVAKSIINYHNTQTKNKYCNYFKNFLQITEDEIIKDDNKKFVRINGIDFDYNKIKHIVKLIGKDASIFTSQEEKHFINISGSNGYAFLLGCRSFKNGIR